MIKSMTAYGRGECSLEDTLYIAEARSLNHRYMDIILRLPKNFLVLEKDLKTLIATKIRRGRIEVYMEMQYQGGDLPYELELNGSLAESYINTFEDLAKLTGRDEKVPLEVLWQMKDVISAKPAKMDMAQVEQGFQDALLQSINALDEMRRKEGDAIEADFLDRVTLLGRYLDKVEQSAPLLITAYQKRLTDNIGRMLEDMSIDENRLVQEVAFFAEKTDITEEIVRMKSHLGQFREYLSEDDVVGRKLDFLIQEINREVNTIGSKTADSVVSKTVVEMKAELEKLREQVQNIE